MALSSRLAAITLEVIMHISRPLSASEQVTYVSSDADIELERQEYLDESHVESTQYGVGRSAEADKPRSD